MEQSKWLWDGENVGFNFMSTELKMNSIRLSRLYDVFQFYKDHVIKKDTKSFVGPNMNCVVIHRYIFSIWPTYA